MCELMGICSNVKVNPEFSFKEIKIRGGGKGIHKDGWGIGYYDDTCKIIKEPRPAYMSPLAMKVSRGEIKISSKIIITHIRYATAGGNEEKNTHPFKKKLNGKEWIFAHNGVIGNRVSRSGVFGLELEHFRPEGDTDSEYAFCYMLDQIKKNPKNITEAIRSAANEIKRYGTFNFLLSDSENLYAFGHNALYYTERDKKDRNVTLSDADYTVNVSDMKRENEKAVIIATKSLTCDEGWNRIEGLMIFKEGDKMKEELTEEEVMMLRFMREAPKRVSVNVMIDQGLSKDTVSILSRKGLIKQDSRDRVAPLDDAATYYTNHLRRDNIDAMLNPSVRWFFAYGSLMVNLKSTSSDLTELVVDRDGKKAILEGYHRDFNKKSTWNWGSKSNPGIVLGIEEGGRCEGIAFEIKEGSETEALEQLKIREIGKTSTKGYEIKIKKISINGREVDAYVAINKKDETYCGELPMDEKVRMIKVAVGKDGKNPAYVENCYKYCRSKMIDDENLSRYIEAIKE